MNLVVYEGTMWIDIRINFSKHTIFQIMKCFFSKQLQEELLEYLSVPPFSCRVLDQKRVKDEIIVCT